MEIRNINGVQPVSQKQQKSDSTSFKGLFKIYPEVLPKGKVLNLPNDAFETIMGLPSITKAVHDDGIKILADKGQDETIFSTLKNLGVDFLYRNIQSRHTLEDFDLVLTYESKEPKLNMLF